MERLVSDTQSGRNVGRWEIPTLVEEIYDLQDALYVPVLDEFHS